MTLLDPENVRIGITGALYKAPTGSTAATDAATALDAAFINLGYVSDGIAEYWDDSVNDIIALQNATHVRSAITESRFSLELSLLETKGEVLEMLRLVFDSARSAVAAWRWSASFCVSVFCASSSTTSTSESSQPTPANYSEH